MPATEAFYSWGRLVANCGNPDCFNAMELTLAQAQTTCELEGGLLGPGVCGTVSDVTWPSGPTLDEVELAFAGQSPQNQSWSEGEELPT